MEIPTNKKITIDCDAFSFVIVADTMDDRTKKTIKDFLHHFGTDWSAVSVPTIAIGANK
jgi:hypothetical protein